MPLRGGHQLQVVVGQHEDEFIPLAFADPAARIADAIGALQRQLRAGAARKAEREGDEERISESQ